MGRKVAIGIQDFGDLIRKKFFYVDKTSFLKEWWESGFGRYDVMLEPKNIQKDDAFILEFKVFNKRREQSLSDTVQAALSQIEGKQYAANLIAKGIPENRIRCYGFAFLGKEVLIG